MLLAPSSYAFADSSSSPSSGCNPVAATSGTDKPTGAWAGTFAYNSCTGLYENKYYTWSPATHTATYIWPMTYSCDTASWRWEAQQYVYVAAKNDYEPSTVYADQLPAGATLAAGSPQICVPPASQPPQPAVSSTAAPQDPTTGNSGAASGTNSTAAGLNTSNNASMTNYIGSVALSGNALVSGNTTGGDATSGPANAMANVLNAIQSTTSLAGAATFVANIDGTVQGDLLIDPSVIQPASGPGALNATNNLTVNAKNSGQIDNTVNLNATSGNAQVSDNTKAGGATSGNATAVADVMNMINTMIGANQSFVGVININGNLQGNILVPQNFIDTLLASNAPTATMSVPTSTLNNVSGNITTDSAITNNVTSKAQSGQASVAANTTAGAAATGTATTNVTVFNLTGSNVIGKNALLVFVNVLGRWVGVIMNAPAGSTAAAFGGDISANNNAVTTASTDNRITNDIAVAAKSGDASVTGNTTAGGARSGNADTAVNLLNVSNSNYSLSNWFGVLFINVFGSWFGNFGVLTPAAQHSATSQPASPAAPSAARPPRVFQFRPAAAVGASAGGSTGAAALPLNDNQMQLVADQESKVLADAVAHTGAATTEPVHASAENRTVQIAIGAGVTLLGIGLIVAERLASAARSRR